MTISDLPATLSVVEAGSILGLSRSAAYRAAKRGEIPTITLSGRLYVPTARLLAMLGLGPRLEGHDAAGPSRSG